jgi:hypothetical protein
LQPVLIASPPTRRARQFSTTTIADEKVFDPNACRVASNSTAKVKLSSTQIAVKQYRRSGSMQKHGKNDRAKDDRHQLGDRCATGFFQRKEKVVERAHTAQA